MQRTLLSALLLFAVGGSCSTDTNTDQGTEADTDAGTDLGTDLGTEADTGSDTDVDSDTDADTQPVGCLTYPVPMPVEGREASVTAALLALDGEGTVTWDDARDNPRSMSVYVELAGCTDDEADVYSEIWNALGDNVDVFGMIEAEWADNPPAPCRLVTEGRVRTFSFNRTHIGGQEIARDVATVALRRTNGVVHVQGFSGTYLPPASDALATDLSACPDLDPADAAATARASSFDYTTFFQCQPTGRGTHRATADDLVLITPSSKWSWYEDGGTILFEKSTPGVLRIPSTDWTQDLLASNAYCPAFQEIPESVAWRLTFDAVTGSLVSSMPGEGCIVC